MTDFKKDIVHKEAFRVLKNDLLNSMIDRKDISFLHAFFGYPIKIEEFMEERGEFITKVAEMLEKKELKSKVIKYILEKSETLQEYTLYLFIFSTMLSTAFKDELL